MSNSEFNNTGKPMALKSFQSSVVYSYTKANIFTPELLAHLSGEEQGEEMEALMKSLYSCRSSPTVSSYGMISSKKSLLGYVYGYGDTLHV